MYDEEIEKTVLYYLIFEKEQINVNEDDFFFQKHKRKKSFTTQMNSGKALFHYYFRIRI